MNIKENLQNKSEELIRKVNTLPNIAIKWEQVIGTYKHPLNSPTCSFYHQSYSCSFIV